MRSLTRAPLRQDEETYRLLVTMVKKLKMSKKEERLIYLETVADLMWLNKILVYRPEKYAVTLNAEEVAKVIVYMKDGVLHIHDVYVSPKYRKQKLAKALLIEMLSDHRDVPMLSFHTRESNKPVHNLVQFFVRAYNLPDSNLEFKKTDHFYVDGGHAVIYNMQNPAHLFKVEVDEPQQGLEEVH